MWEAAQVDNPNPKLYIPAPINGFTDLKKRMLCEEYETGLHRAFLEKTNNEILELKKKHATSIAQITEQKEKLLQLQHRLLRVSVICINFDKLKMITALILMLKIILCDLYLL